MFGQPEQSGKLPNHPGKKFAQVGEFAHQPKGPPKLEMHKAIRDRALRRAGGGKPAGGLPY